MPPSGQKRGASIIYAISGVFLVFFVSQQYIILQQPHDKDARSQNFIFSFDNNDKEHEKVNSDKEDCFKEKKSSPSLPSPPSSTSSRHLEDDLKTPDGTFNTFPIYHTEVEDGWHSNVHCIGDNFQEDAWKFRSCHFQNLCFDTEEKTYAIFASPEQIELEKALEHSALVNFSPSSSMNTTVALGGINPKWGNERIATQWYPKILPLDTIKSTGYYSLHSNTTLVPYHSLAGFNPGHLVWDDFLPIYTLLTAFGLLDNHELVLMRMNVEPAMWASCQRQYQKCKPILTKFLPLMGMTLDQISTQNDTVVTIKNQKEMKSKYICAPNGAAGLGSLTDHGLKLHGWIPKDYTTTYNHGRGASLYAFRNFMMKNMGIEPEATKIHSAPYRIVISVGSSAQSNRSTNFDKQMQLLKEHISNKKEHGGKGKYDVEIVQVRLSSMSVMEQIRMVSGASIFITMCGGGAISAMFLPRGASMFAFYNEGDGEGGTPARLDWDLLNNIGYLRLHWLPRPQKSYTRRGKAMEGPGQHDYDAFVKLVEHELDVISHTNDY
mmetsp:Transcript_18916/g.28756  ORF Transcript_18916/g.28756 Transcript_18916/m.28756 type:complete len:549 (-) Transcript_18916:143-1789(-)